MKLNCFKYKKKYTLITKKKIALYHIFTYIKNSNYIPG